MALWVLSPSIKPSLNFATPPLKISNCCWLLDMIVPHLLKFQWFFNNSAEQKEVENRFITTNGSKSVLTFTPTRTLEYGTLMCRSTNAVGQQKDACIFHIIAAGKKVADSPTYGSDFRLDNATVKSTRFRQGCISRLVEPLSFSWIFVTELLLS